MLSLLVQARHTVGPTRSFVYAFNLTEQTVIFNRGKKGQPMKRKSKLTIAMASPVLAILAGAAVYAQDKYRWSCRAELRSPTSRDTRIGRWSLRPGLTKCSR